jgi:hypothetical protein
MSGTIFGVTVPRDVLNQTARYILKDAGDALFQKVHFLADAAALGAVDLDTSGSMATIPFYTETHNAIVDLGVDGLTPYDPNVSQISQSLAFGWKHLGTQVLVSGAEVAMNSGKNQIIKVLDARINSQVDNFGRQLQQHFLAGGVFTGLSHLEGSGNGNDAFLQARVRASQTTGNVGGILRSVGAPGLQNFYLTGAGVDEIDALTQAMIDCEQRSLKGADKIVMYAGSTAFRRYKGALYPQEQYVSVKTLDGGTLDLAFRGRPFKYVIPMDSVGSGKTIYGVNFAHVKLLGFKDRWLTMDDFRPSTVQDAEMAPIHWSGQLVANHLGSSFRIDNFGDSQ